MPLLPARLQLVVAIDAALLGGDGRLDGAQDALAVEGDERGGRPCIGRRRRNPRSPWPYWHRPAGFRSAGPAAHPAQGEGAVGAELPVQAGDRMGAKGRRYRRIFAELGAEAGIGRDKGINQFERGGIFVGLLGQKRAQAGSVEIAGDAGADEAGQRQENEEHPPGPGANEAGRAERAFEAAHQAPDSYAVPG